MADSTSPDSPLEAAAGAAGPHITEAFELLGNETRLAILLALWEAYTPYTEDDPISFSELRERVGVRDSGQFNYHLGKLTGHYVEETEDGYELRSPGLNIVQAVIAGTGLTQETMSPTEVQISCTACGAPTEISYENSSVIHACTECDGYFGDGVIAAWPLDPAGLDDRHPAEIYAAGHIAAIRTIFSFVRGVCPSCSGGVKESLQICDSHAVEDEGVCPTCGAREKARVRWVCSICKEAGTYNLGAAVFDQPVVHAFLHEQGIDLFEHVDDPESAVRVMDFARRQEFEIVSENPLRVRVTMPGTEANLDLTVNQELELIDATQMDRDRD